MIGKRHRSLDAAVDSSQAPQAPTREALDVLIDHHFKHEPSQSPPAEQPDKRKTFHFLTLREIRNN